MSANKRKLLFDMRKESDKYDKTIIRQSFDKYGKVDEKQKSDVAIVLGASTDANGVSPVFKERINHGIWLYENNYVDYIIVNIINKGEGDKNDE